MTGGLPRFYFVQVKSNGTVLAQEVETLDFLTGFSVALDAATNTAQITGTIANNTVTDAMLRDSAAVSVIGRAANSTGDPADIAASANGNVLRRSGNVVGFGAVDLTNGTNAVTGALTVPNGGSGLSTATTYAVLCGGTTATGPFQPIASVGTATHVLTSNGAGALPTFQATGATITAEQASTSGTSIDFTGIPSGVKRITVMLVGVSTNGVSPMLVQLGDSGGIETSGYLSSTGNRGSEVHSTAGFVINTASVAAAFLQATYTIYLQDSSDFTWSGSGNCTNSTTPCFAAGSKATSAELTQVRVTTVNGTDAFDAGVISVQYSS